MTSQAVAAARFSAPVLVKAIRVHQWLKNLLVFAPVAAAHKWGDTQAWWVSLRVFATFCLSASAIYLVNDLLDVQADRAHPRKRLRPIASGAMSTPMAIGTACVLLLVAVPLALTLPNLGGLLVAAYAVSSLMYSFILKRIVLVDVFTLAGLYTLRILSGGVATATPLSFWLLAFSGFLFLSLAIMKRITELHAIAGVGRERTHGRDYTTADSDALKSLGISCGNIAVLVLAFYLNTPEVERLYTRPQVLWVTCAVLLYWISRLWIKTDRHEMNDDPIIYTLRDRTSLLAVACAGIAMLLAV